MVAEKNLGAEKGIDPGQGGYGGDPERKQRPSMPKEWTLAAQFG